MTQSSQYRFPAIDPRWSDTRETHPAVAAAIHAISDSARSPEAIWEGPTEAECQHVTMAIAEYLRCDLIKPSDDGRYQWGLEAIEVAR
jgi:hypothetical protein